MEFTTEDLFDKADELVRHLLARQGTAEPPVDAVAILEDQYGFTITVEDDLDEDGERELETPAARYVRLRGGNAPPRRKNPRELVLRESMTVEARNSAAARAVAREAAPDILKQLGVVPGTEQKSAMNQLVGLLAPRLLLPKRWFEAAARKKSSDVARLKETFATATMEAVALKLLELDDICVIAVVDDGVVQLRRSNGVAVTKTLTPAEKACVDKVGESDDPATVRKDGWTARGWPAPTGAFRRIIVRSQPDDV